MKLTNRNLQYMRASDKVKVTSLLERLIFAFIGYTDHLGGRWFWDRKFSGLHGHHYTWGGYYGGTYDEINLHRHLVFGKVVKIRRCRGTTRIDVGILDLRYIAEIEAYATNLEIRRDEAISARRKAIAQAVKESGIQ